MFNPRNRRGFLNRTQKTTGVRFFDAEERSGFSTRGVLKFRQITIFWRDIFLSPIQDHKQLREF
jgi:hypothetical protein